MGAWSTGSFGNDDALDWFGDLTEAPDVFPFIQETLEGGTTESIIAAGAVLALLSGYGDIEVHPDVAEWAAGRPTPPSALNVRAANAIQDIIEDPEADGHDVWAELGEDDEDYVAWLANLKRIQTVLQ
ncbi:DUF4259 domain-containing protein [Paenarthrobacter nicotinovorans]|uniref:DUF4259 domain-containing protein n=1 Tax=Paenarthrobacter nicotinovorans TaxID=29320 RepID=A0ABV0GUC2_PAENI